MSESWVEDAVAKEKYLKTLKERIAELEEELKECKRTAFDEAYERADTKTTKHFDTLTAENQWLWEENARLREAARRLLQGIEAYQYGVTPPIPLPGIASAANELEALLGGGG